MKEIRTLLDANKLIIGTKVTIKKLNKGLIDKIFIAKNCSEQIKQELNHLAKLSNIKVISLDMTNEELGTFCRKPFNISVVSKLKD